MDGATFEGQRPPFAALPVWLRGQLDPQELAVLWTLQSFYPEIRPGAARLARECKIGRSTLFNVLARLEKRGLIARVHRTTTAGDPDCNLYRLQIWEGPPRGSAPDALPSPADGLPSASCGLGVVQQVDGGSPADGHKEDQMNKNKIELDVEGPIPREREGHPLADAVPGVEPLSGLRADGTNPRSLRSNLRSTGDSPRQRGSNPRAKGTNPLAVAAADAKAEALGKPKASRRPPVFIPGPEAVPCSLLPVEPQIRAFWAGKAGARSEAAWDALMAGLDRIRLDPDGGTHVVAEQLDAGIQAGWSSVTYANWQRYGKPARVRYGSQTAAGPNGEGLRGSDAFDFMRQELRRRQAQAEQEHTRPMRYA